MDLARLRVVLRMYAEARRLPAHARAEFVERSCAGDAELRRELEGLLEHGEDLLARVSAAPRMPETAGTAPRIQGFRLQRLLGRGSSGVVYVAEQLAFGRQVALKLLRAEVLAPEERKRFEREGRLLARLNHPGIAQVYASGIEGSAADSRPWIALELIRGRALTQWAREESPHVHRVLGLMAEVCDAVQHAHERGIIHRDLKPHNILVDDSGRAHVLDFGLARGPEDGWRRTLTGSVLGTLCYMSPEQASGDPRALDARSDVYALGALLHELLDGAPPHACAELPLHEALERIREHDAPLLGRQRPQLRGDVETMVATALARDPARRYPSAAAFADDLRRHMAHKPIVARRTGMTERFQKLARRHRSILGGLTLAFTALLVALLYSLSSWWGAHGAEHARLAERDQLLRLADERALASLHARAHALWPPEPEQAQGMSTWLEDARRLVQRLPLHRGSHAGLRIEGGEPSDSRMEWARELSQRLVAGIEALSAAGHGSIRELEARRAWALEAHDHTVGAWSARWEQVSAEVADPRRSPLYGGLRLLPQDGLVPLGPDPVSGLQEFALWEPDAALPQREGGALRPAGDDMLVLVLIPGGCTRIGAQRSDASGAHYDPEAGTHEGPPREVDLDPYLISKHEVTLAQWRRWERRTGAPTARAQPARDLAPLLPASGMSWLEAVELLRRMGLQLPTEAQWEHAARGGEGCVYPGGDNPSVLVGLANIGFQRSGPNVAALAPCARAPEELHPVGWLRPNRRGLHDVIGNVSEYCLDHYKIDYYRRELRRGDGLVLAAPTDDRSVRGGACGTVTSSARLAFRGDKLAVDRGGDIGVRPARALRGWSPGTP